MDHEWDLIAGLKLVTSGTQTKFSNKTGDGLKKQGVDLSKEL